jgi:hypothetical protein
MMDARYWLRDLDPITFSTFRLGLAETEEVMTDEEVEYEIERLYPGGMAAFEAES